MKCLAVNTSTSELSVAVVDGERVLYTHTSAERRDQGNTLMSRIVESLQRSGLTYADLDLLAVVTGPGSFTGIRLGIAAMRGLALAAGKPLVGISSFEMFAAPVEGAMNIVAVESWRSELYFAVLDSEANNIMEPVNVTPEDFMPLVPEGRYVISGDARGKMRAVFPSAQEVQNNPGAVEVAALAIAKYRATGVATPPVPYYLRPADVSVSTKIQKKTVESS